MRPQCIFSPSFRPIHFRRRRTFCPRRALVNFGSKPHKIRTNDYSSPHFDRNNTRATPRMLPTPYSRFPRALCRPILPLFYPFMSTIWRQGLDCATYAHERKPFLSRAQALFITRWSSFYHERKGAHWTERCRRIRALREKKHASI